MRSRPIACIVLCCVCLGLFSGFVVADYGGGDGSSEFPFLISEPAHLIALGEQSDHWNRHFQVVADIDMEGSDFETIGGLNHPNVFIGTFDGNGHTISNLNDSMFTRLDFGTIKNVRLENATATGWSRGLLVNLVFDGGTVDNCFVRGSMSALGHDSGGLVGTVRHGSSNIKNSGSDVIVAGSESSQRLGGLVGRLESGTISNCYSTSTVTAGSSSAAIGGLVGKMDSGTIEDCFTAASVKGVRYVGGIVGELYTGQSFSSTIINCYSMSDVTVREGQYSFDSAGGIAGRVWGTLITIDNCHSSGTITGFDGSRFLGGLIGHMEWGASLSNSSSDADVIGGYGSHEIGGLVGRVSSASAVSRCYSAGSVTAEADANGFFTAGGLVGSLWSGGTITDSYSNSIVSGAMASSIHRMGGLVGFVDSHLSTQINRCFSTGLVDGQGFSIGGLIGKKERDGGVAVSFWDKETSGQTESDGGLGLTTEEMQNEMYFSYSGWDLEDVWMMFDYPGLRWQPEIGVSGDFSVSVPAGQEALIECDVFGLRDAAINWVMQGHEDSDWITEALPVSGSSNGPSDVTNVSITVDTDGLALGRHVQELTLIANDKVLAVPIVINVYNPVSLDEFALLAAHWATVGCDFGQPCKAADWYVDGVIDIKDLLQLAESWLGEEIVKVRATVEDGFESGDFSVLDWQHDGAADWIIVDSGAYEGTYAAKSGAIDIFAESTLEVTLDLTGWEVNTIGFAVKVSTLDSFHYLRFYVDDDEKDAWSGLWSDYTYKTYTIEPGVRTFRWTYMKGPGVPAGEDSAWIDDIRMYAR